MSDEFFNVPSGAQKDLIVEDTTKKEVEELKNETRNLNNGLEEEILKKIEAQEEKLEKIFRSVEKTRKYFLWVLIISVAMIVLPLVGMAIAIPKIISTYSAVLNF